jgi:tripeptide aminopeptidase
VQAYESCGITPVFKPMRGGTDGCIISHKGLPTPNLFSGTENGHGKYEFVTLETLEKSVDVIMAIAEKNAALVGTAEVAGNTGHVAVAEYSVEIG